jgi:hypothetical protein
MRRRGGMKMTIKSSRLAFELFEILFPFIRRLSRNAYLCPKHPCHEVGLNVHWNSVRT